MNRKQFLIATALVAFVFCSRLLPHPANFAPLTAVAIFSGSLFPRRFAVFVPVAAAVLSDVFLGFYNVMPIVWACYLLIALASSRWLKQASILRGASFTVAASVFFFATTNLAVWAFSGMYTHNINGLSQCFTLALPFFRNSLLGDLIYTASLFGCYSFAQAYAHTKNTKIRTA